VQEGKHIIRHWLEQSFHFIKKWWGLMSGWLSVPFMVAAALNFSSQRLIFASLAYASLGALVISQMKEIARLRRRTKKPEIAAYDDFDGLVKEGDAMLEKLKNNKPPLPTETEVIQWNERLITLAESCATISERNRLRDGSVMEIKDAAEIMQLYVDIPNKEHYGIGEKLASKVKVSRKIMERLRQASAFSIT
jgi:hypothetical protein